MSEVEVEFDMTKLSREIRRYEDRTRNLPMDLVGTLLVNEAEELFETEGASGSQGRWEPFAPSTLQRHPRRIGGSLLQDTGATANVQVDEVSAHSVTIRSPTDYAGWHLDGTENMPRRDFFAFKFPKVLDEIGDLIAQELLS